MEPLTAIIVGSYGLILGSFFNVLIWRLPRQESIIHPGSHCPRCGTPLKAYQNIPVLSYLALRGRCSACSSPISPRYPAIELITGGAALSVWYTVLNPVITGGPSPGHLAAAILGSLTLLILIPISVIDIDHYIIPDVFTVPGLVICLLVSFLPGGITPQQALLGVLAGGGSLYALGLIGQLLLRKEEAMGGGDIKLMAFLGALWGWDKALIGIMLASFSGTVIGGGLMLMRRLSQDRKIPFGPFLALGMWLSVIAGDRIVSWYLSTMDRLFLK